MGIPQSQEYSAMLAMLICGMICGALYDIFRISRVLFHLASYSHAKKSHRNLHLPLIGSVFQTKSLKIPPVLISIALAAGDILYSVICGCVFSICLAHFASGIFRWFYLLSAGIGWMLYYFSVGRAVLFASEVIVDLFYIAVRYILWFILLPFRLLFRFLSAVYRWGSTRIFIPLYNSVQHHVRLHYTDKIRRELVRTVCLTEERSD